MNVLRYDPAVALRDGDAFEYADVERVGLTGLSKALRKAGLSARTGVVQDEGPHKGVRVIGVYRKDATTLTPLDCGNHDKREEEKNGNTD